MPHDVRTVLWELAVTAVLQGLSAALMVVSLLTSPGHRHPELQQWLLVWSVDWVVSVLTAGHARWSQPCTHQSPSPGVLADQTKHDVVLEGVASLHDSLELVSEIVDGCYQFLGLSRRRPTQTEGRQAPKAFLVLYLRDDLVSLQHSQSR
jgi:hypothetical protein